MTTGTNGNSRGRFGRVDRGNEIHKTVQALAMLAGFSLSAGVFVSTMLAVVIITLFGYDAARSFLILIVGTTVATGVVFGAGVVILGKWVYRWEIAKKPTKKTKASAVEIKKKGKGTGYHVVKLDDQ